MAVMGEKSYLLMGGIGGPGRHERLASPLCSGVVVSIA